MQSVITLIALFASTAFGVSINARQSTAQCVDVCFENLTNDYATFGCASANDYTCLCKSDSFIDGAAQCFAETCDGTDAQGGLTYGENLCKEVGVVVTVPAYASSVVAADTATTFISTVSVPPPPASTSGAATTSASASSGSASATTSTAPSSTASGSSGSTSGASRSFVSGFAIALVGAAGVMML